MLLCSETSPDRPERSPRCSATFCSRFEQKCQSDLFCPFSQNDLGQTLSGSDLRVKFHAAPITRGGFRQRLINSWTVGHCNDYNQIAKSAAFQEATNRHTIKIFNQLILGFVCDFCLTCAHGTVARAECGETADPDMTWPWLFRSNEGHG